MLAAAAERDLQLLAKRAECVAEPRRVRTGQKFAKPPPGKRFCCRVDFDAGFVLPAEKWR